MAPIVNWFEFECATIHMLIKIASELNLEVWGSMHDSKIEKETAIKTEISGSVLTEFGE